MERITRFRVHIMLLVIFLVLGFYAVKIFQVQIIENDGSQSNITTFTTITRVKAARGEILDRNGNILVGNRASYDLVINHYVLLSAADTNKYLLQMVELCQKQGIEYNENFPMTMERPFAYTLDQYNSAWQSYFQTYLAKMDIDSDITAPLLIETLRKNYGIPADWTDEQARAVIGLRYEMSLRDTITSLSLYVFLTDASDEERAAILELNVPGMNVESSVVREYYTTYAAHILGSIGKMDSEQLAYYESIGGYSMDAEVGQSGLELAFEEYLHGTDGWRVDVVTTDGTVIESYYQVEPKAGNNVETTIDLNLQMAAEDALADRIESLRNGKPGADGADVEGGSAVAMDVKTGEILACASYPTFDLSSYNEKFNEILEIPYNALFNRALQGTYPPGSVYKMSMVIAGIDSHVIGINQEIEDKGIYLEYQQQAFTPTCLAYAYNGSTHGMVDARKALERSCNYYFYWVGDHISLSAMDSTAKALGLGEPTGVELPENIGYRANAETKQQLHGEDWYIADQILAAIGQSDNRFTPMQLCVYASTLANQGTRYKATFLKRVVSADYMELVLENSPKVVSTLDISEEAFTAYSEGMYLVTSTDWGTANATFMHYSVKVAGKTGTAEGTTGSDNGSFVCYAPYDPNDPKAPEIAIAVYGEKAGHGSTMAVVARDILDVYFAKDKASDTETYENLFN